MSGTGGLDQSSLISPTHTQDFGQKNLGKFFRFSINL